MKRTIALLAAIGLIAAAVLARGLIDGDIDLGDDGGGDDAGSELTVVCISELSGVCDALHAADDTIEVRVEEAQVTLDSLVAADFDPSAADFDAWLTVNPYPVQVSEQTTGSLEPVLGEPSAVIARSPMTLVGWNERLDVLAPACGGTVTWACVGEHSGDPWSSIGGEQAWGPFKPGLADPATTATGLLTVSQATASWFGSPDFFSNDFSEPGFEAWFSKLASGVPSYPTPPRTPLEEMLSLGRGAFDVAGSIEATSAAKVATSRDKNSLTLLYPAPMVTADVVLVPVGGSSQADDVSKLASSDDLQDALADVGRRVPDHPVPEFAKPDLELPPTDGLPAAGVVQALRAKWLEVT